MWLNKFEENVFGPFCDLIKKNINKNFEFELNDGALLTVSLHLYEFESDNGLDSHESGYEEYYEMSFKIIDIIKDDTNIYKPGQIICINYHCIPKSYKII